MWDSVLNSLNHHGKLVELRCSNYDTTNRNAMLVHGLSASSRLLMIDVANSRHDAFGQHVLASIGVKKSVGDSERIPRVARCLFLRSSGQTARDGAGY